jgi:suppressor of G2 allele of SKP1
MGTDYNYTIDPLFAPIDTSASTSRISPAKVELTLRKKEAGLKWKTLESADAPKPSDTASTSQDDPLRKAVLQPSTNTAPVYPTSSKTGPKNWDKIVTEATKKPKPMKSKEDKEAEDDGEDEAADDMDDLDYGGDEANFFFKKLYASADEDTKRAMMKSYVESNGTVLSTNWADVGKGKVETSPPDGMEAKNWGK